MSLNPHAHPFAPAASIGEKCKKCSYVYVYNMVMVLMPPGKYGDEYSRCAMHSRECRCYFKGEMYLIWAQHIEAKNEAAATVIQRAFRMHLRAFRMRLNAF